MLKVVMSGAIESLSTVPGLSEAMAIFHLGMENPKVSGRVESMETGEVLAIMEDGEVTYLAPETMAEMMDTIFVTDPMKGLGLLLELTEMVMGE